MANFRRWGRHGSSTNSESQKNCSEGNKMTLRFGNRKNFNDGTVHPSVVKKSEAMDGLIKTCPSKMTTPNQKEDPNSVAVLDISDRVSTFDNNNSRVKCERINEKLGTNHSTDASREIKIIIRLAEKLTCFNRGDMISSSSKSSSSISSTAQIESRVGKEIHNRLIIKMVLGLLEPFKNDQKKHFDLIDRFNRVHFESVQRSVPDNEEVAISKTVSSSAETESDNAVDKNHFSLDDKKNIEENENSNIDDKNHFVIHEDKYSSVNESFRLSRASTSDENYISGNSRVSSIESQLGPADSTCFSQPQNFYHHQYNQYNQYYHHYNNYSNNYYHFNFNPNGLMHSQEAIRGYGGMVWCQGVKLVASQSHKPSAGASSGPSGLEGWSSRDLQFSSVTAELFAQAAKSSLPYFD